MNVDFSSFVYNYIMENYWEIYFYNIKRFLELIPKDLLKHISFYVNYN